MQVKKLQFMTKRFDTPVQYLHQGRPKVVTQIPSRGLYRGILVMHDNGSFNFL